jgi:hypothetical protein
MPKRFDLASTFHPAKEEKPMKDRLISLLPGVLVTVVAWAILWTLLVTEVE